MGTVQVAETSPVLNDTNRDPIPPLNPQSNSNSPLDDLASFPTVKLDVDVDVDETAFVRIGVDPQKTEAFVSTVAPSTQSNALPAVTSFDLMRELEVMAGKQVVMRSL